MFPFSVDTLSKRRGKTKTNKNKKIIAPVTVAALAGEGAGKSLFLIFRVLFLVSMFFFCRAVRKRVSMLAEAPKGDGDAAISGNSADADGERYGVTDFRSIARWKFAARPFLAPEEQAKMTIGVSDWLIDWSVDWLGDRLADWLLVGWWVGWLIGGLVGWLIDCLTG